MTSLRILEKIIIKSFCFLDAKLLTTIGENIIYSYKNKEEMIIELEQIFNKIKLTGLQNLKVKDSNCKFCYPTGKAYSFHNPDTDEFIIRYVIHQESEKVFRVEECRNIPPRKDGMPF